MATHNPELPIRTTLVAVAREIWANKWAFLGIVVALSLVAGVLAPQGPGARRSFYLLAIFSSWAWLSVVSFPSKELARETSETATSPKGPTDQLRRPFLFSLRALGFAIGHILVVDLPKIFSTLGRPPSWASVMEIAFFVLAARLSLILPASAADVPTSFRQIWDLAGPIWVRLCAVLLLASLAGGLIGLAASIFIIVIAFGVTMTGGLTLEFSTAHGALMVGLMISTLIVVVTSCLGLVFKAVSIRPVGNS